MRDRYYDDLENAIKWMQSKNYGEILSDDSISAYIKGIYKRAFNRTEKDFEDGNNYDYENLINVNIRKILDYDFSDYRYNDHPESMEIIYRIIVEIKRIIRTQSKMAAK